MENFNRPKARGIKPSSASGGLKILFEWGAYVEDALNKLKRPIKQEEHQVGWVRLRQGTAELF